MPQRAAAQTTGAAVGAAAGEGAGSEGSGYQASARAMSTMDEMLDVLINRTGRVGL
jgi:hypothetical protein